jgi:hypothetical protein
MAKVPWDDARLDAYGAVRRVKPSLFYSANPNTLPIALPGVWTEQNKKRSPILHKSGKISVKK